MIDEKVMNMMSQLDSLDEGARMDLLSQVDEQRDDLLGALLKQLGTSQSKHVQAAAVYLIGRHRLSKGVGELFKRIDFDAAPEARRGKEPLWERYPAMEALIHIGRPSIRPALELLATDASDVRRELATKVVRYVEDAEVAEFILKRAHAAETDQARKANLDDALARLANLPK